jgi:hypothetical protein
VFSGALYCVFAGIQDLCDGRLAVSVTLMKTSYGFLLAMSVNLGTAGDLRTCSRPGCRDLPEDANRCRLGAFFLSFQQSPILLVRQFLILLVSHLRVLQVQLFPVLRFRRGPARRGDSALTRAVRMVLENAALLSGWNPKTAENRPGWFASPSPI